MAAAGGGAAPPSPTAIVTRGVPGVTVVPSSTKSAVIVPLTVDLTARDVCNKRSNDRTIENSDI